MRVAVLSEMVGMNDDEVERYMQQRTHLGGESLWEQYVCR